MPTDTADISLVISPRKLGYLFQEKGIPASVYHAVLLYKYDTQIYEWEPETLAMDIAQDFGVNPSTEVSDKIHGIIAAMTTDCVTRDFHIYASICHALNDNDPSFEMISPVTPEEAAWASYEILLNRNEKPDIFRSEVKAYVRTVLLDNGFFKYPPELSWCDLPKHVDVTRFMITDEAKKVQEDKLKRIEAYVSVRRQKMLEILRTIFPNADYGPNKDQISEIRGK